MHDLKEKIGLIAGGGDLPHMIINQLNTKHGVFVLALKGNMQDCTPINAKHEWVDIFELEKSVQLLRAQSVKTVVFAGKVARPALSGVKFDGMTLKLLAKLGLKGFSGGDDKVLSVITDFFKTLGFSVLSPEDIMPGLLCKKGLLTSLSADKNDLKDIAIGIEVLRALGAQDVGQSVIVENGYVLGIEAAEGTDLLISRCKYFKKEPDGTGVLVKLKKTMQNKKMDLPAIGVDTIKRVHDSGFKGVAIEAKNTLFIEKDEVIRAANALGIFLVGV